LIITWKIPLYPPFAKGDLSGQNYFHAFVAPPRDMKFPAKAGIQ